MTLLVLPDFTRFLVAAKQATYAGQSDFASVTPLIPGSKQLEFSAGDYLYRDIYVGMFRFVGQEIVYFSGKPVWSMSYSGGLLPNIPQASAIAVYSFLRTALRALPPEFPIRGPELLEAENYRYICQHSGSIESFHGQEVISESGQTLYELHFSGGQLA